MHVAEICVTLLLLSFVVMVGDASALDTGSAQGGSMAFGGLDGPSWHFGGELGRRIERSIQNWILRVPAGNPGILDMFRRRDRHQPYAPHTPWAGEFAGKYVISAVQTCRLSRNPALHRQVAAFVRDLISTQDADGYLGPWPKDRRLLGDCDLWGHYHCMLGLLLWSDLTGDQKALQAVFRAADLICRFYGPNGRRPIEAGNPCFNLSVLHIMAELYRRTHNERYVPLLRRIEEDLAKDGNWLQGGLDGVPYWRLPGSGPRWEALHILQGLVALWQATGEEKYRKAVLNHWRSIRDLDRHPSGAFSTNEQASGTIFASGSIETCCSVAWMALTIDVLRMTGDPTVADELELTLWNQALAAQHPSGSWCTYDTPLNGVRAPSYHQINFQYRPGSPELNCCSVNSPRTLGMLSDWAVMRRGDAFVVNFYGPCKVEVPIDSKHRFRMTQRTGYPVGESVRIGLDTDGVSTTVLFRIPAWSRNTKVTVNGKALRTQVRPGTYLELKRKWQTGDEVVLMFEMRPRLTMGEGPQRGSMVAIHRGPLLLAFDEGLNETDVAKLNPVDVRHVELLPIRLALHPDAPAWRDFPPMVVFAMPRREGGPIFLCDFASAGARGTEYAAWLRASHAPPAPVRLQLPHSDQTAKPGPILFRWSSTGCTDDRYTLVIARDRDFRDGVVEVRDLDVTHATVGQGVAAEGEYFWKVVTQNAYGSTDNRDGPRTFRVDVKAQDLFLVVREDGLMAAAPLDGSAQPTAGILTLASGTAPAADRHGNPHGSLSFSGTDSGLRYRLPFFPEKDYSFSAWVKPSHAQVGMGQIMSAWRRGMDDPLRVTVEGGEVSARMEAGQAWRTPGVRLVPEQWIHVAAVKQGPSLRLYVGGREVASVAVPEVVQTMAEEIGIGFNPFFAGGERFVGCLDDIAFWARALTPEEIRAAAEGHP